MATPSPSQSTSPLPKPPDPNLQAAPTSDGRAKQSYARAATNPSVTTMSYAAAAETKVVCEPRFPDLILPPRQYSYKDGIPSVSFSANEIQAANNNLRNSVVAKFQMGRPSLPAIKDFVQKNWQIKGRVTMSSNWDDRHVVFIFDLEEDVTSALVCPYRKVNHTFFRLFRWTPDYDPKKEATLITKWVKLPNLHMSLYNRSMIKAILSSFAHFLDLDDKTRNMTSLSICRACVEIDISKPIPSKVKVNIPSGTYYQDVIIEGSVEYCSKCKRHGHMLDKCLHAAKEEHRKNKKQDSAEAPDQNMPPAPIEKNAQTTHQTTAIQTAAVDNEKEVAPKNKETNVWVKVHSKRKKTMKPVRAMANDLPTIDEGAPIEKMNDLATTQTTNLEEGEIHGLLVVNKEGMNHAAHTREPSGKLTNPVSSITSNIVVLDQVTSQDTASQSSNASATGDKHSSLVPNV